MSSMTAGERERVADQVHSAAIHVLRCVRRSDVEIGLSAARLSALSVLVFAGEQTLGELAEAEQVKPPTMTRLIQALEADGLVAREAIAEDKRAVRLRATRKGRRLLKRARRLRVQRLATRMASLSAEELRLLVRASQVLEDVAAGRP